MSFGVWIAFLLAAAVGASGRYLLDSFVEGRHGPEFPWGTCVVNISGSFVLGVITGLALYHGLGVSSKLVLVTGFCGAYTTFSTFSVETDVLLKDGHVAVAVAYVVASLVVGIAAAWFGVVAARKVMPA